ncbi:MAG: CAAX prenyl protease-related protein [Kiritimatiellia bacterium]
MVRLPPSFWLIAPYAAWMALMAALPATAAGYAVRTAVVAVLLAAGWLRNGFRRSARPDGTASARPGFGPAATGLLAGLAVFVLWILPEQFGWTWYGRWCIVGEGGTQAVAEAGAAMIAIRLVGSACVISVAEELFFRQWMIGFAGFWWTVGLFAVEHDRWLVGALAGIVYGGLYLRQGLRSAIVAHVTTNLALGLWVLRTGQWQFW